VNAERIHAQNLLDHLVPEQVAAVVHLMEVMLDPISRKLASAPPEDETISADEERAVDEARQWRKQNKPVSHEEVLTDFGLTMDDFQNMALRPSPDQPSGDRH
jgi:hypothetical protein